jgi:phosphate starvation-inducible PhoH-like protein
MPKSAKHRIQKVIPHFQQRLIAEQNDAKSLIYSKDLTIITGKAGSGKTLVAVYSALTMLLEGKVNRIIITRPPVEAGEGMGFLPGGLEEKMDPWLAPIYENLELIIKKDNTQYLVEEGKIDIRPIAMMRGQTYTKCAIIVDEAQNVTHNQMELIVGRLGRDSKMMICGDARQKDLNYRSRSGLPFLIQKATKLHEVAHIELQANHRHDLVDKLLNLYLEEDENKSKKA